ncbi:MAG: MOSC domain-containing protein [Mycobacterium sp.]
MAKVLTVNLAQPRQNPDKQHLSTGIDKRPTDAPVAVRAPGPRKGGLGSGLAGDSIGNDQFHGGDDQAVYAYARADLDAWETRLDRRLGNGVFGENLTTTDVDVTGAVVGERWHIGAADGLELEVSSPRTPCRTFALWLDERGWMRTFTAAAAPGAYLRVIRPGTVRAGDAVTVVDRPDHGVTVGLAFRAMTLEPDLLPQLLAADALPEAIKQLARRRVTKG